MGIYAQSTNFIGGAFMESATNPPVRSVSILASYLLPHALLDLAADGDTAEVRSSKARRNKAWLMRWLPIYIRRWGLLFMAFWLTATLIPVLGFPAVLGWVFEFAQYVSACVAVWLALLYLRSRLEPI